MPGFDDVVEGALDILRRRGRVSLEALRRTFELEADALAALRDELVDVLEAAEDRGRWLVATADRAPAAAAGRARGFAARTASGDGIPAERRQITVLTSDLVESTALSMRMDAEDLRELMSLYRSVCGEAIDATGGHVTGWQGDGVFVLYGYPRAGEEDAVRAVRCAWAILQGLVPIRARFRREHDIEVAVRIGVHTGTAVVGDEADSTGQTLTFGETPNIAARIAAAAQPDTIAVTEATRRLVAGYFEFESLGTPKLKGVTRPHELYRLVGPGHARQRFDLSLRHGLTPLVNRVRERERLRQAAAEALGGATRAVLITGEPGIGKSRLVHEARMGIAAEFQQIDCECSPYHSGTALLPIVAALRRRWKLRGTADEQLEALRAILAARPDAAGARQLALLATSLGLPLPADAPPLGSPGRQRLETLDALAGLLCNEARRRPLLLTVEDAHWIDPSTVELLTMLLQPERDFPLLVLITARPEFESPWGSQTAVEPMPLARLQSSEARALILAVTAQAQLAPEAVERLSRQTDGVPMFVEELTRAMLEAGSDAAGQESAIPTTLYGCLMARLDRDHTTLTVAQVAAAIGRQFGRELLLLVCPLDEGVVDACLQELVSCQLLEEVVDAVERRYSFRHALIQEAALSSMLRVTRHGHHGRIADVTMEHFPATVEEHPEVLAQHLEAADRPAEAVAQWMRAGLQAVQRSANAEAIMHLDRALELLMRLPDDDRRARTELPLRVLAAVPLTLTRGWTAPGVEAHYRRAQDLCRRVGDAPELFPTLVGLMTYLIVSGQLDEACAMGIRDLALAREHEDSDHELAAEVDLGNTLVYLGRPREALVILERVAQRYDPARHHRHAYLYGKDPGAIADLHRGLALWSIGKPDAALACAQSALTLIRAWPHPFTDAWVQAGAALLLLLRGEVADVQRYAEIAVTIATVEGFPNWVAQASVYRGWALVAGGDDSGLTHISAGLDLWGMTGAQLMVPFLRYLHGDAQHRCGQTAAALVTLGEGRDTVRRTGETWWEPELSRLWADLSHREGEISASQAGAYVRAAADRAVGQGSIALELRCATTLARMTGARADFARLRACYEQFDGGHDTGDLIAARTLLQSVAEVEAPT